MLNSTAEATQAAAAAAAASANTDANVDPALFAKELGSRLVDTTGMSMKEKISVTMERLATSLPGTTITNRSLSSFAEAGSYFVETGLDATINISAETMEQMAGDEDLFEKVKSLLEGLMKAGENQNLVNTGGDDISRNININNGEVRYVEVQRNAQGSTMSVASLAIKTQQMLADTIEKLLTSISANYRNATSGNTGGNSASQNFALWGGSQSNSKNFNFNNIVSSNSNWRFEMLFSSSSIANQTLNSQRSFSASLDVMIEQVQNGGTISGMDLQSYIEWEDLSDPLVFDLGGEGINLTSADDGVYFDIKGDGSPVQTAFIQGNNAFLYLDENGNGVADDANELFGDQGGHANGFEKLRQYDDNGDGVIDENDAVYSQLRLWRDLNGDGVNQTDESLTLAEAGIKSIDLNYNKDYELDQHGNVIGEKSSFTRTDGSQGLVADVWLKSKK
ncbi:MAG: hypothetical protein LUC93_15945 [Planctomycetaceae bacterium]|nr:hypothetical protein [Planctomycetaceae bacterium]